MILKTTVTENSENGIKNEIEFFSTQVHET